MRISAAWRLSALGQKVVVLERDGAVGGMGKTIKVGCYAVDYGPHTFHIRETEESRAIHHAIEPFFGPDPLILTRGTRVLLRGKEYVYPLEMLQVLTDGWPVRDPIQQGHVSFSLRRYDSEGRPNEDTGDWKIDVIEAE